MPDLRIPTSSSVTKRPRDESFYSIGMEKPPLNEKRAGSYFAQICSDGTVKVIDRDRDLAASGVGFDSAMSIGVLGFVPADS